MKRVATAVVLIPIVLLIVFKAPVWLFAIIVGAVALLTTREYLDLVSGYNLKPLRVVTYLLVVILFTSAALESLSSPFLHPSALRWYGVISIAGSFLLLALAMRQEDLKSALPSAALSALALLYVGFPLLILVEFIMPSDLIDPLARFKPFALLLFVWGGDTFAYYIGRGLGRHKLAPRISPQKTWEGTAGSVAGSVVAGVVVWAIIRSQQLPDKPSLAYWIGLGIVANIAGQIGDLVESMMKRGAGIKDSGSMLPGHGGMLDRIDALLFAAPAMWYYPLVFYPLKDLLFRNP